jgi:predicted MFS family arabinose efflux permease
MASVPLLHETGHLSFPALLAIVFGIGVFLAPSFSAQRLILPELVGDDERTVAQGNALLEGVTRSCGLVGPALAGVLIAALSPASVLYVDAATFVFSAATVALFVPSRPPRAGGEDARGLLAGVRFLLRDRLLTALGGTALVVNMLSQMLVAGLPVLAYESFGGSSRIAGAFFAAFGAGAVAGSVVAMRILPRFDPIRLGAAAFVALTLPIWALVADLPAWGVVVALFASAFFGPLVNAPLIGVITMRTPEPLRAKVMTAVITFAMLAGPVGLFVAGPLLQSWGPHAVFALVAAGELLASLGFAAVALRHREPAPAEATIAA